MFSVFKFMYQTISWISFQAHMSSVWISYYPFDANMKLFFNYEKEKEKEKKKPRKGGCSFNEHCQKDLYPESTKSRYFVPQKITIEKW